MKIPIGMKGKETIYVEGSLNLSKIIANRRCGMSAIATRQAYILSKIMEEKNV